MLGGAVAGLPTSAAAAASAAAVAGAAHKQFHPNSPPLDLESWKEAFLQQANNNTSNSGSAASALAAPALKTVSQIRSLLLVKSARSPSYLVILQLPLAIHE